MFLFVLLRHILISVFFYLLFVFLKNILISTFLVFLFWQCQLSFLASLLHFDFFGYVFMYSFMYSFLFGVPSSNIFLLYFLSIFFHMISTFNVFFCVFFYVLSSRHIFVWIFSLHFFLFLCSSNNLMCQSQFIF